RLSPFADGEALFIAEFAGETGRLAPRNLLKDQLARAGAMGFQVTAGFEYEFFLLRETPASVRVKDYTGLESWQPGNHTYSMVPSIEHDFFDGLETVLELLGIGIDSIHTEQGPGCVEMPLKPAPGLIAADNAALFKTFTKAHCERQGLMATFMAKWSNQTNGQSGHLHVSLQDDDGNALFHDPADPQGISATMRHFVGGLVTLLPETLAMCSHTVNAYRRMVPGIWAPVVSAWGVQNRTCAVRVITGAPGATRVEFRVPAADSNPHLTLAQCLGAGLWGIENRIDPGLAFEGEAAPDSLPPERRLPRTLGSAADRLDASPVARGLFGDAFVDWFVATRRHEDDVFRRHVSDLDRRRYLDVY
ncbi:MAG: glutamine synthetase, partial [Proteobacteria bacterium]|nr:glutamine synthetase [Pseudomonadota bacterium]